ncbi:antibiotic biosynthesis monooxygenase family protein [Cupriavidus sp. 2SB]|uniref:putative quinol monooxygenase n=1 Tax=Cupriavidus sp. 2SB TaxID=2502199 RepID=UPI0010F9192B|nr:antibiotic biosynthesis monooxygenase family protein [Cupriavidus sp. 2SB]
MKPIAIIATITADPGAEAAVRDALMTAVPLVRQEPGCERYELLADIGNERSYVMVERWHSESDLEAHTKSPAFTQLTKALSGIAKLSISRLTPMA